MAAKLTLTIDDGVIKKAKKYANENERSLSNLVENYLLALTSRGKKENKNITPFVASLRGGFSPPANFDCKKCFRNNYRKNIYISKKVEIINRRIKNIL